MLIQRPEINAILNPTVQGSLSLSASPGKKSLEDTVPVTGDKGQLEDTEINSEEKSEYESEEDEEETKMQEPEVVEQAPEALVEESKTEEKPAPGGFSIGGDESDEEVENLDN